MHHPIHDTEAYNRDFWQMPTISSAVVSATPSLSSILSVDVDVDVDESSIWLDLSDKSLTGSDDSNSGSGSDSDI